MSEQPADRADAEPRLVSMLRWGASGVLAVALHGGALIPLLWIALPRLGDPVQVVLPVELIRLPPSAFGSPSPPSAEYPPEAEGSPGAALPASTEPKPAATKPPPPPRRKPEPARRPALIERAELPEPLPAAPAAFTAGAASEPARALSEAPVAAAAETDPEPSNRPPPPGDWRTVLVDRLERNKRYPVAAEQSGQEGITYVRFTMDRGGVVLDSKLVISSGHLALDEEALSLPHRSEPLPTPPAGAGGERIQVIVPVQFSLH
jgi:protein TonB